MTRDRRPFPFLEAFPPRPNEQPEPFSDMSSAYTFIRPYLDANGAWCAFDWRSADPLARSANEIASTCASTGVHMLTSAFPLLLPVGPEALADETLCATFSPKQAVFLLPEQALSLSDTVQRSTDLRARGRQMELLCIALDPKPEILDLCDSAYMTGLFSLLEVLINLPMQDIVKELPLQDEVLEALATPGQGGQLSRLLAALCAGEAGRYQEADERFAELGISPEKLTKAQATAFLWASHIDRISLD